MALPDTIDCHTTEAQTEGTSTTHIQARVVLADDQEEILGTIAMMLDGEFQIVGMAENGAQVLELVAQHTPDVLVLDIFMPVLNGFETAAWLKASGCPAKILFVTVQDDPDFVESAMSVGALGYVLKPHLATDLIPAIRSVLEGHRYISSSINSNY
ncbi:MAG TPA: response regulator transcription factor [Candidatus Sulfotelmatobacter sp.]|nr:response regulator transcription factor [Candidatus Sulfotelmatobacter sp.]